MALELKTDDDITQYTDAELVPDGDKDTVYFVRHLTPETLAEMLKRHTKKVPNRRTHQRDDVTDREALMKEQLDYALTDWSGVISKGVPLKCTPEAKRLLDAVRQVAILDKAGLNTVVATPESRAESFRETADVR